MKGLMIEIMHTFSSFSVSDIEKAKQFYQELGLNVRVTQEGLNIDLPGGAQVFIYPSDKNKPADFTVLNLVVSDIDQTVDELEKQGIVFEHYTQPYATDEKGILRGLAEGMGPDIAWFKDPFGNIISVLQEKRA